MRVVGVEDSILHVEELDLLDGTPVLDIKPYVPLFDARETTKIGWFGRRRGACSSALRCALRAAGSSNLSRVKADPDADLLPGKWAVLGALTQGRSHGFAVRGVSLRPATSGGSGA